MLAHNRRIKLRRVCDGTSLDPAPARLLFSGDDIDGMLDAVGTAPETRAYERAPALDGADADVDALLESGYHRIARISDADEPPTARLVALPKAEAPDAVEDVDDIEELTEGITEGWDDSE